MPNLNDIVEIVKAVESKPVLLVEERCSVVRNRRVKCRRCVDVCLAGALEVSNNSLACDFQLCVGCGACSAVCPVEAIVSLQPLDSELSYDASQAMQAADNLAVFACARISSKRKADPAKYAEVPCLARMEESVLVELAASGSERIVLVDGDCSTCKYRACVPGIDATVASANALLAAEGLPLQVERSSAFPDEIAIEDPEGLFGVSRRGFFTGAKDNAKEAAEKFARAAIKRKLGEEKPRLREKLRADGGSLPTITVRRHTDILDAMDRIGSPVQAELETRLWGSVRIDAEKCTTCLMCVTFCPTGALSKSTIEPEDPEDYGSYLEFSMADCVQCRTCEDICLKQCLTVDSVISTEELFDFEPRMIYLPEPSEKTGFLSSRNSRRNRKK